MLTGSSLLTLYVEPCLELQGCLCFKVRVRCQRLLQGLWLFLQSLGLTGFPLYFQQYLRVLLMDIASESVLLYLLVFCSTQPLLPLAACVTAINLQKNTPILSLKFVVFSGAGTWASSLWAGKGVVGLFPAATSGVSATDIKELCLLLKPLFPTFLHKT